VAPAASAEVDFLTRRSPPRRRLFGQHWESTQFQCADCRHYTSGLIEVGKQLAAQAVEMREDEFSCEAEEIDERTLDPKLSAMADGVTSRGERFAGNNVWDMAEAWTEAGFSATDAAEWMDAGFWDPDTAATVRDTGITAEQAAARAEALVEAAEDAAEDYTDGDPIYSICNGDTPVSVLTEAD
jgi:hypothetical protein